MPDELTNLLPILRKRALTRDYFLRLGVVAIAFMVALIVAAGALLVPTYLFLKGEAADKKAQLTSSTAKLSSAEDAALTTRLATLSAEADALLSLANLSSPTKIIRSVLEVSRVGIVISGIAYSPATTKRPGTLSFTGRAQTRDALRTYQLAMQKLALVKSADLPVSAYASSANIPFTISVTLAP